MVVPCLHISNERLCVVRYHSYEYQVLFYKTKLLYFFFLLFKTH